MAKPRKSKKKRSYRHACEVAIANGNENKFTEGCAKRFPELVDGDATPAPPKVPIEVSKECNAVLSSEMKKGNRKGAMSAYWRCRRKHAAKK